MTEATLAIGVWGYPPAWKPAVYRIEERRVESRVTLDAIVEAYNPDRVLLIIPDTVASHELLGSASSYTEVVHGVAEWLYDWVKGNTTTLTRVLSHIRIEVAPNIGSYGGCSWRAPACNPYSLYAFHALRFVFENLADLSVEADRIRVLLDTSHGINYMPLAAYDAVRTAAMAIAAATNTPVEIVLFNSEPYTSTTASKPQLSIHQVERVTIAPSSAPVDLAVQTLSYVYSRGGNVRVKLASSEGRLASVLGRMLNAPARELVDRDGVPAIAVMLFGLPLAAAYIAVDSELDIDLATSLLSDAIDTFRENTLLSRSPCEVLHLVCLEYGGAKVLLASAAIIRRVKAVVAEALGRCPPSLDDLEDRGVYLEELGDIANGLKSLTRFFINFDLHDIEAMVKSRAGCRCLFDGSAAVCEDCRALRIPLYCGDWPDVECYKGSIDYRNFLAHGGIEYNAVEATMDEYGIALRYRRGCWEHIRSNMLKQAAREVIR